MGIAVKVSKRTLNFSDTKTEMYVASADRGDVITTKNPNQLWDQEGKQLACLKNSVLIQPFCFKLSVLYSIN